MPLLTAHSWSFLSLSSTYCGFFSRKLSSQSKVPSSGNETGKSTSYFPSLGTFSFTSFTSSLAASWSILHLKGKATKGVGPKFTCNETFRKATCGKRGWPFSFSGKACGSLMRLPLQNRLTVLALGLFWSKLSNMPMAWSRPKRAAAWLRFLSARKHPSESKHTQPSPPSPRTSEEPATEKPRRTSCRGMGTRLRPAVRPSRGVRASRTFTS
mmetsp:Transcript_46311/g.128852  ORF Transcript_46311/g.128852 Transcript_46311/m.128852 type:complete len:212 (-) Transcript_46311:447-1082(-)